MNTSGRPIHLVLHPGHPKCGSSSIQHALRANIENLADRGIYYPPARPNRVFIQACRSGDWTPVEGWIATQVEEVRRTDCDTLVISSENIAVGQLVEGARRLHELLVEHFRPVDVIYYIRRQDDWMVSQWQQWGHHEGMNLDEFIDNRLEYHQPGYLAAAELFEEMYDADRLAVVPLHRRTLIDGDLITDFADRSGVGDLTLDDPGRRRNPSMSGFLCEILARVPEIYDRSRVAPELGRTDHSIREILSRHVSEDLLFNRDKRVMTLGQRRRVMAHFEEDNRTLHGRYFDHVPFEELFGLPDPDEDVEIRELSARVDGLQDLVAMQMQVIVELLREREERQLERRVSRWVERVKKPLRAARAKLRGEG